MANVTALVNGNDNAAGHEFLTLKAALDHFRYDNLTTDLHGTGGPGILNVEISITTAETGNPQTYTDTVTSAAYYVNIYTTAAARHAGVWSESKYRITTSQNYDGFPLYGNYVRIAGIQFRRVAGSTQNGNDVIGVASQSAGDNDIRISNCLIWDDPDPTYYNYGLYVSDGDANVTVWNCIIYGSSANGSSKAVLCGGATTNLWNCTIQSGAIGLQRSAGTVTAKNCYAAGSDTNAYAGTITMTNCASSDATADGTDPHDSVAFNTSTFVNVTAGSEDFHLAGTGSGLYGHGADNTGDSAPLNYTTDIDGDTITGRFDIGADWYYTAATGQFARPASDVADGNWLNQASSNTNLFESINEEVASDADFIISGANPDNDTCTVALSAFNPPVAGTWTMRIRAKVM